MAKAEIMSGVCGFNTVVEAHMDGDECVVSIQSECESIQKMAQELNRVDPFREISFRGGGPEILKVASRCCKHTACPVPAGIVKAVEVAAGLALPKDASIKVSE